MVNSNGNKGSQSASFLETQLRPLMHLEATYRAFDTAERELCRTIGVPICMPNCGRCCAVTTATVSELEARFLISSLLGEGASVLEKVLARCEGWLLDRDPLLTIYGLSGTLSQSQWDRLRPEVDVLLLERPCPMLTEEKSCLVHGGRPFICRAYGVTRMPARLCPRPLSRMESDEVRGHIGENSSVGRTLKSMVRRSLAGAGKVRFLATALFAYLRPDRLNAYVADNLIASAKLVLLQQNPAILFQNHLNQVWAQETTKVAGGQDVRH